MMNNKKGFTLIEILVALAISAIFITLVISLVSPSIKIFDRVGNTADARQVGDALLQEIRNECSVADTLEAEAEDASGNCSIIIDGTTVISVDAEGHVTCQSGNFVPELIFDEKFYNGNTVSLRATQNGDAGVDITLDILSGDKVICTVDSSIKPISAGYEQSGSD